MHFFHVCQFYLSLKGIVHPKMKVFNSEGPGAVWSSFMMDTWNFMDFTAIIKLGKAKTFFDITPIVFF